MEKEKIQILENVLGAYYCSNSEYLFACPHCKHYKKKLSVNLKLDVYKCWVCDSSGKIGQLVRKFGRYQDRKEWDKQDKRVDISDFDNLFKEERQEQAPQRIKLPDEFISLANSNLPTSSRPAINYLKKRNIFKNDILKWKMGYCSAGEYKNRIIIPSFGVDGYCNYFVARAYTDDWLKYKNPPASRDIIFNELFIDWDSDIILVEGAFDAVVPENSIPLLGSTLSEKTGFYEKAASNKCKVFVALDNDAEKKALKLLHSLRKYGIEAYKINTSGYDDVGEMTREEFLNRKSSALMMSQENYILYKIQNVI